MAFLLIASFAAVASAKSFLDARVGAESIQNTLMSELSGLANPAQLAEIEGELRSMYAALPKNEHGRLDSVSVRYALHRYFMHKHGWFVNGLGASNSSDDSLTATTIMKDRAPSFIQKIFEQRMGGHGLDHHSLAVFAATLTDLVHHEVGVNLQSVYASLELPTGGPVTHKEHEMASKAYLLNYLSSGHEEVASSQDLPEAEQRWAGDYPAWADTWMWVTDLKNTLAVTDQRSNPFVRRHPTFERHVKFLQEVGHRLGTFQNLECFRLKDQLVDLEDVGTGRVPLSRFYRGGLDGEWQFTESVEYLRHIGALDETNPSRMMVVIPNYIQSQSNCLAGSSFYSVCCSNECESLLGHVEDQVQAPSASPDQLAHIVSNLQSDTVLAPRNLSAAMLERLHDVANVHGGKVPLHGRLFAQWMHHAYPRECPFPHVIGAADRLSSEEWMDAMDVDSAEASEEEMALLVSQGAAVPEAQAEALPWSMVEELVAGHLAMEQETSKRASYMRCCLAALVMMSLLAPLAQRSRLQPHGQSSAKAERFVV